MQGRCTRHGIVEGLEDRRGRLRCPEKGCRLLIAVHPTTQSAGPVRDGALRGVSQIGDLDQDPEVREQRKALTLVNYQRAIREAQRPTAWEEALAKLEARMAALETVAAHVDGLHSWLQELDADVKETPLHGFRARFECECGSRKLLAIQVKCTSCGEEKWFGQWPRKTGRASQA